MAKTITQTMKEKLANVYTEVQGLQMPPTRNNIAIMADLLNTLQEVHDCLTDLEKPEENEDVI